MPVFAFLPQIANCKMISEIAEAAWDDGTFALTKHALCSAAYIARILLGKV